MCAVVSLQLAAFGKGFHAGGAVEDSGLLGAGRRARLVELLVFLQADPDSSCLSSEDNIASTRTFGEAKHRQSAVCVCARVCVPCSSRVLL